MPKNAETLRPLPKAESLGKNIRKVVVLGGSAGGLMALCQILKDLPEDLEASLLAVIHAGERENRLAEVLQRSTPLHVVVPTDAEPLRPGCLYLAPPNRHLMVRDGCAFSVYGPRENKYRPAVDVLFRSAARAHHSHVIAVILSGALDDGSAGALAVKARKGTVIVQTPGSAEHPGMPENVIRYVGEDYSLPLSGIAPTLIKMIARETPITTINGGNEDCQKLLNEPVIRENEPVAYSCPECGGALLASDQAGQPRFRCHVGHAFSLDSFSEAETEALERAIWTAYRKLKEHHSFQLTLANREPRNGTGNESRFRQAASATEHDLALLHGILSRL